MRSRSRLRSLLPAILALFCGPAALANAQGLTGQITGTVVDATRGALPGATVALKNVDTQVARATVTDASGAFVVTNLLAGTYDIAVSLSGFRLYEQRGVVLTAAERVALAPIVLQIGGVSEQVLVEATALKVQSTSGERSGRPPHSHVSPVRTRSA